MRNEKEDVEKNRKDDWQPAELHPHQEPAPSEPTVRLNTEELRRAAEELRHAEEQRRAEELRRAQEQAAPSPSEPTQRLAYPQTINPQAIRKILFFFCSLITAKRNTKRKIIPV